MNRHEMKRSAESTRRTADFGGRLRRAVGIAAWRRRGSWSFPYRRSVGPVIGAFLTGLRDRRVVGVRTAGGRVLVPPFEYDPETGEAASEMVDVASEGVVEHAAWVPEPLRTHPLDRPFAWALVRLDGADTPLVARARLRLGRSRRPARAASAGAETTVICPTSNASSSHDHRPR